MQFNLISKKYVTRCVTIVTGVTLTRQENEKKEAKREQKVIDNYFISYKASIRFSHSRPQLNLESVSKMTKKREGMIELFIGLEFRSESPISECGREHVTFGEAHIGWI